jgi:hypothetical protein
MLGVLIVILGADCIAVLVFGASERHIPLKVSLRAVRAIGFGTTAAVDPAL